MLPPAVLVVDTDVGFLFALSQELSIHNIGAVPATETEEASALVSQLGLQPDLLVIDCAIPDACAFAVQMARLRPGLPVIGITSEGHDCNNCPHLLKARFRHPEDRDPRRIPYCAAIIEALVMKRRRDTQTGRF